MKDALGCRQFKVRLSSLTVLVPICSSGKVVFTGHGFPQERRRTRERDQGWGWGTSPPRAPKSLLLSV